MNGQVNKISRTNRPPVSCARDSSNGILIDDLCGCLFFLRAANPVVKIYSKTKHARIEAFVCQVLHIRDQSNCAESTEARDVLLLMTSLAPRARVGVDHLFHLLFSPARHWLAPASSLIL